MRRLCPLTVSSARNSRSPISWFEQPLGDEPQHFQLALAQRLDQRLGSERGRPDSVGCQAALLRPQWQPAAGQCIPA